MTSYLCSYLRPQIQQAHEALTEQFQQNTAEMQRLRERVDALTRSAPPAPSPQDTLDALSEQLGDLLLGRLQAETAAALAMVQKGVEEALRQQQQEFCQGVWVKLTPALSIISAMQDSMEKAKEAGQILGLRAPPPQPQQPDHGAVPEVEADVSMS